MKITKSQIKQLIKEELKAITESYGYDYDEFSVGDMIEVTISDDGYDKGIERVEGVPDDFDDGMGGAYAPSAKFLAKIVKIAGGGE